VNEVNDIVDRAKSGLLSKREVSKIARELAAGIAKDPYTAIHVLGLMNSIEHEQLVARYLRSSDDPMIARIALQVLSANWGLAERYRSAIEEFARGVAWDSDADVRLAALSAAGELARASGDAPLVALLLSVLDDEGNPRLVRQAAYFALARASGKDWRELPPASRRLDLAYDLDGSVLRWARASSVAAMK